MDSSSATWLAPLMQLGVAGVMLAWFMFQVMPRLKAVESAIDRMSRVQLIVLLSQRPAAAVENQSREILAEIDQAEKRRGGG